jgi:hypothetical protein
MDDYLGNDAPITLPSTLEHKHERKSQLMTCRKPVPPHYPHVPPSAEEIFCAAKCDKTIRGIVQSVQSSSTTAALFLFFPELLPFLSEPFAFTGEVSATRMTSSTSSLTLDLLEPFFFLSVSTGTTTTL